MKVILGPVRCQDCRSPVVWGQNGEVFGWREPSGAIHRCAPLNRPQRDEAILLALGEGRSYPSIAADYGVTKQRVGQIAKRLGHRRYLVTA